MGPSLRRSGLESRHDAVLVVLIRHQRQQSSAESGHRQVADPLAG